MKGIVVDSSAIIAFLKHEPGAEVMQQHMTQAICSAVNFAEVVTHFAKGFTAGSNHSSGNVQEILRDMLQPFVQSVVPFDSEMSFQTGFLRPLTKHLGLSLGDHACLALAKVQGLPVLTADKIWKKLEDVLEVDIQLIR